jgi:hypothetical protein
MIGPTVATLGGVMSTAKTCLAGLVLFSLGAAACTSDGAAEARARAERAEARVETLGADLAETGIALAEVEADLEAATAAGGQLEEDLAAVQAELREKELVLAYRTREMEAAWQELAGARAEAADLSARLGQLQALSAMPCPLPSTGLPAQALPPAVAETRARIHNAAVTCDWLELHRLADEAGGIGYADGAVGWTGDPVPYWLAVPGELRLIAGMLELSFGMIESEDADGNPVTYYVWPAADAHDVVTEADWAELRGVYTDEYLAQMQDWGEGYAGGFTVWIRGDGVWQFALHVSV